MTITSAFKNNFNNDIKLGIAITGISVWWVRTTLKEDNKALKERQKEDLDN